MDKGTHDAETLGNDPLVSVEEAPDPEEDDLDDLDDLLDEFSTVKADKKVDAPASSGPGRPEVTTPPAVSDGIAEDFNAELQKQMAALMGGIDETPEMKQQLEDMMRDLGVTPDSKQKDPEQAEGSAKGVTAASSSAPSSEDAFQETIRKTMERMQASGAQATAAATDDSEDMLAQMLKEMQGEGTGGEEDFSKMLLGMMEQLTNKEILYEPMKELHDKFPAWMIKNKEKTPADDLLRYIEQQRLVGDIVGRFEKSGYSDNNPIDREFIVERMQKMQAAGSPPADLVGDMKDAQEALGDMDSGCPQQ